MPARIKLVYLPPAAEDFQEIVKFHINQVGTASARRIYERMESTLNRLCDFPLLGQTHPDPLLAAQGYRKLVLTSTYVAVYKLMDDMVYIYRIVNGKTNYPALLK